MLKLLTKIGIVLIFALMLSFGVDVLYRRSYHLPYELPKNILPYPEIADKYTLVKLGNSHADDGITFEYYNSKALSLSSVAQSFEFDLAQLKMYERQIETNAVILINISPISFIQKKPDARDAFQYNYYDGRLSPLFIPRLILGDYLQSQIVPFVRTGYLWRDKYNKQVEQTIQNNISTPAKETPPPEILPFPVPTTDPRKELIRELNLNIELPFESEDKLIQSVDFMSHKWYDSGDFSGEYLTTNSHDLERLIAYCLQNNWRPVLISVPISQALLDGLHGRDDFKRKYVYEPLAQTNTQGAPYFDFSQNEQFIQNGYFFGNSDHLSGDGSIVFSYMLLHALIENGYLPPEADGYKDL